MRLPKDFVMGFANLDKFLGNSGAKVLFATKQQESEFLRIVAGCGSDFDHMKNPTNYEGVVFKVT